MANNGLEHLIERFDGSSYQTWSDHMEMFFHQEERWDHVNASIIRWMDLANQTIWNIKDAKARANILLCMKNIQLVHVKLLKTSKEIWDQIKTNF